MSNLTEDQMRSLVKVVDGVYVERDVLNIAEKVYEYSDRLRIKAVHPGLAEPGDAPYILTEICNDGIERKCFDIWELDERVLERIYSADTQRHDILLALDMKNARVKKEQNQRFKETIDEAHDIIVSMLKSPKHRYTVKDQETGNTVVFDDRDKHYQVERPA